MSKYVTIEYQNVISPLQRNQSSPLMLFLPFSPRKQAYLRKLIERLFENFLGEAERIKLQMFERSE